MGSAIVNALADDKNIIPYRRTLNHITGCVTATILLQQMLFRAKSKGFQPFFKFRSPCEHELYKEGDSWTEELGFSLAEFDSALRRISTKLTKGTSRKQALDGKDARNLVIYWTDSSRVTWYVLNVKLLSELVNSIYSNEKPA